MEKRKPEEIIEQSAKDITKCAYRLVALFFSDLVILRKSPKQKRKYKKDLYLKLIENLIKERDLDRIPTHKEE